MTTLIFSRLVTSSACLASHNECVYSAWPQRGYKCNILSSPRSFAKGICPGSNAGPWTQRRASYSIVSGFLILTAQQQKQINLKCELSQWEKKHLISSVNRSWWEHTEVVVQGGWHFPCLLWVGNRLWASWKHACYVWRLKKQPMNEVLQTCHNN